MESILVGNNTDQILSVVHMANESRLNVVKKDVLISYVLILELYESGEHFCVHCYYPCYDIIITIHIARCGTVIHNSCNTFTYIFLPDSYKSLLR